MLDYMRKNAGSWIIKIMLFGIVVVFAFWGVGPTGQENKPIVTIGKVKVPYSEYQKIYNNLVDTYRQVYDNLDSATIDLLDLKGQALNGLIERYLLLDTAEKLHVGVSPEEVAAQIASTEAFQVNGIFVPQRYQSYLDFTRTTAETYESSLAEDIIISKVSNLLTAPAVVTTQEVDDSLELLTRQAVAKVLELTPNDFVRAVPPATEEQINDYFEENIELYRVPETFRVSAAIIDPADFREKVVVSTEDMEDLYEDLIPEFTQSAAFHILHILFSIPENATAESIREVRTLAEDVADQIREEEISFADAAKKYSDDKESTAKGGDLGLVTEKQVYGSVWDAIMDLEAGEMTDPVPTAKGFEIIKVIDFRPESTSPFEEVKGEVEQRLRQEQSTELAYDLADDILDLVYDSNRSLADVAEEKDLLTVKTPLFSRDSALENYNLPVDILESSFSMEEEELGDISEQGGKLYLYQVTERNDPYLPELDAVRDEVKGGLLVKQAMDLALKKADELLARFEDGQSIDSLAASVRKKVIKTDPFTVMDSTLPGLPDAEPIIEAAFSIREPGGATVASGLQAHYLVALEEFKQPDEEELNGIRPSVREALQAQKEKEILDGYLQGMREKLKDEIVINEELI